MSGTAEERLMAALLGGIGASEPTDLVASEAARIRGFERAAYLYGAREIPLMALLARQVFALTGGQAMTPQDLGGSLTILLGLRGFDPKEVRLMPVTERALEAILSMRALVDGELFFYQEAMRGQLRTLPVESSAPEAVFEAWRVEESPWATEGALRITPRLDEEDGVVHLEYDAEPVARWNGPRFVPGVFGEPYSLGCERAMLQVLALAPRRGEMNPYPLWEQAVKDGYTTSEKAALVLVLSPDLSLVANLLGGPAANNVLGENIEAVFQGAHTDYSIWSEVVAKRLLDEWVAEKGSLTGLETPHGIARLISEALPAFIEGRALATDSDSSAQRSFGYATAEWVGSLFTPDRESGAGLVREIISRREQGENVTLETRITEQSMHLAAVALDEQGAVLGERAFK